MPSGSIKFAGSGPGDKAGHPVQLRFLINLEPKGLRRAFFDTYDLAGYDLADKSQTEADVDRVFEQQFNASLQVQANSEGGSPVTVNFGGTDPKLTAQRLNQFITFTNKRTIQQLLNNINATIQAEIGRTHSRLASQLKLAEQKRQDRILNLREALSIAKVLGVDTVDGLSGVAGKKETAIEINTAQIPLYMRGTKAIKAEIATLEARKSDEPFISGWRDLQEKLASLKSLSINPARLSAVTIDAAARTPYRAEKPREKLIFVLAGVLCLMMGVFLAFIAEFRSKSRAAGWQNL